MNAFTANFLAVVASVFVLTVIAECVLIPILRFHKVGQIIYDLGPRWHQPKQGVPTMGGIGFIQIGRAHV